MLYPRCLIFFKKVLGGKGGGRGWKASGGGRTHKKSGFCEVDDLPSSSHLLKVPFPKELI
jgi:hypothetical protein